jgi:osmotically-inducible protein OsmY
VQAIVRHGTVTLFGEVAWNYQRERAEHAVRGLAGVGLVENQIHLAFRGPSPDAGGEIERALLRNALLQSAGISVTVAGTVVRLSGTVHSNAEKVEAERVAWSSAHVTEVRNNVTVATAANG